MQAIYTFSAIQTELYQLNRRQQLNYVTLLWHVVPSIGVRNVHTLMKRFRVYMDGDSMVSYDHT